MSIAFLSAAIAAIRSASSTESTVGSAALTWSPPPRLPAPPYSSLRRDVVDHLVRHQIPDRHALTHPAPDATTRPGSAACRGSARRSRAGQPADLDHDRVCGPSPPLEHRHGRALEHLLRLVPARQRRRLVAAQDQEQLVVRRLRRAAARACPPCTTAPRGPSRSATSAKRSSSAIASSHHLEPRLGARVVRPASGAAPRPPARTPPCPARAAPAPPAHTPGGRGAAG